jgi:hypothetical protein
MRLESTGLMHRGLLLALAEKCHSFAAYGDEFHHGYRAAMETFVCKASRDALESFDAVFGVYSEAEAMLLEGMRDLILVLEGPQLHRARFKLSVPQIEGLDALHWAPEFRRMAAVMLAITPHKVR